MQYKEKVESILQVTVLPGIGSGSHTGKSRQKVFHFRPKDTLSRKVGLKRIIMETMAGYSWMFARCTKAPQLMMRMGLSGIQFGL